MKIHDKLWYIKTHNDKEKEKRLAYMTYYKKDKAFEKRLSTALTWAGGRRNDTLTVDDGFIIDNVPQKGFKVLGSVSRWSTSNKLFRILDPRGFIVEIPSGNLATLLLHTTVARGTIEESCVWGRDGSNHILLPITSDLYRQARIDEKQTFIKPEDLTPGDWVQVHGQDMPYYFVGRCRLTWEHKYPHRRPEYIKDKWIWLFVWETGYGDDTFHIGELTPRVTGVIKNDIVPIAPSQLRHETYPPRRIHNKCTFAKGRYHWGDKFCVWSIDYKDSMV